MAGGNLFLLLFTAFILVFTQVVVSGSDFFVTFWTRQEERRIRDLPVDYSTIDLLIVYGIIIIGVIAFTIFRGYLFFNICMKASRTLHDRMFAKILAAPMRFFDTNPSGRILNRFSKDMGAIDELLPKAIMDAVQVLLVMVGVLVVIAIMNPILLIALLGAIILFAVVLKLYLRPTQDLKRLEGISKFRFLDEYRGVGLNLLLNCSPQSSVLAPIRNFNGTVDDPSERCATEDHSGV